MAISPASFIPKISMGQALNWVLIGIMIILGIIIIWFAWWYRKKKIKYGQFRIEILEKDSTGNIYRRYDNAGVFLDKRTNMRLLYLEKAKVGLNPNNIPYVSTINKKGKIIKTVTLRKIGVNNYVFVRINLGSTVEMTVGEEDLNNAASEMSKIRRMTNKESWLSKLAPYIMFIITIMVVLIIVITLFNKFGILKEVSANMVTVTDNQYRIMDLMKNMTVQNSQAPTIIGGVIK